MRPKLARGWVAATLLALTAVSALAAGRGYLGVTTQAIDEDLRRGLDLTRDGLLVNQVSVDSPADRAGLRKGDVILSYEGRSVTEPEALTGVRSALEAAGVPVSSGELTMLPQTGVPVGRDKAESVLRLIEGLEDLDDVQNVYSNFDIPEEILAEAGFREVEVIDTPRPQNYAFVCRK